ncbi:hypothetical protein [Deinococcus sp. UYEF24]
MRQSVWWLAGLALVLSACKNVPDEQSVPIPADGSVLHGRYSGTLTEQMRLVDARTSKDGANVYALFSSAGHAILMNLDPATGAVRSRRAVAAESPSSLGITPDGTLIVAAYAQSLRLDPASFSVIGVLPGAFQVSVDGTRLLGAAPGNDLQDRYRRWDTTSGSEIPTIHTSWASRGITQDLEWGGTDAGTLINLSSGRQVSVSGLLPACSASVQSSLQPLQLGTSADGFYLLENDATLYRLDATGKVTDSTRLESVCTSYSIRTSDMVVQDGILRLVFGSYSEGGSGPLQSKLLTWKAGQPPTTTTLGNGSPLPGSATLPGAPLFSAQHGDSDPEKLSAGQRWTVPLTPVQLNIAGEFTATYGTDSSYGVRGSVVVGGQTYGADGTGATSSTVSPRLVFTQTLCAVNGMSFVAPCPRMDWHLNLTLRGAPAGSLSGDGLLPSGNQRHSQSGGARLSTMNENGLNDGRAFQLSLQPN